MTNPTTLPALPALSVRGADARDLVNTLRAIDARRVDMVVPRAALRLSDAGHFELAGIEPLITDDGVTELAGAYRFTDKALGDLAPDNMTGIPVKYLRRLAAAYPQLLAYNVNTLFGADDRGNVMVRALYGTDAAHPGTAGIVRGVKSDRFGCYDNLDMAFSLMQGCREAGLSPDAIQWRGADLSDGRLWVRIEAPGINVNAEKLLAGYTSPFKGSGHGGAAAENPYIVHAGLVAANDETGGKAMTIKGEIRVRICDNGAETDLGQFRQVHMGARLPEGQIAWSDDTREANLALIAKQARDAVRTFLTRDYVQSVVTELERDAGHEIEKPADTIALVAHEMSYSEAEQESILAMFIRGGQCTSGGVLQAVTAAVQDTAVFGDVARANDVSATAVQAMKVAARLVRTGR